MWVFYYQNHVKKVPTHKRKKKMEIDADENPKLRSEKKRKSFEGMKKRRKVVHICSKRCEFGVILVVCFK